MDHFALVTNLLNGRTNLHGLSLHLCYGGLTASRSTSASHSNTRPYSISLLTNLARTRLAAEAPRYLLIAIHNPPAIQVIRTQLDRNPVAGKNTNEVLAHTSRNVGQSLMLVLKLHLEHRVRQRLNNNRHDLNCIFLRQTILLSRKHSTSATADAPSSILPHIPPQRHLLGQNASSVLKPQSGGMSPQVLSRSKT